MMVQNFQVVPYMKEEESRILAGKYDDPEPIYDKTIPGYPYSDRNPKLWMKAPDPDQM
jgi:hypothetical protein